MIQIKQQRTKRNCKLFVLNFNIMSAIAINFLGEAPKFWRISKVFNLLILCYLHVKQAKIAL